MQKSQTEPLYLAKKQSQIIVYIIATIKDHC